MLHRSWSELKDPESIPRNDPDPERRRAAQADAEGLATLMRQWL